MRRRSAHEHPARGSSNNRPEVRTVREPSRDHPPPVDRRFDSRAWLPGCNHLDYEMLSTHGEGRGISSDLRAHGVEMIQSDDGEW